MQCDPTKYRRFQVLNFCSPLCAIPISAITHCAANSKQYSPSEHSPTRSRACRMGKFILRMQFGFSFFSSLFLLLFFSAFPATEWCIQLVWRRRVLCASHTLWTCIYSSVLWSLPRSHTMLRLKRARVIYPKRLSRNELQLFRHTALSTNTHTHIRSHTCRKIYFL